MFIRYTLTAPIASNHSLVCLLFSAEQLRIVTPPKRGPGYENVSTIDCPECLPTCDSIQYDLKFSYTDTIHLYAANTGGYLEVSYKDLSAIKYRQQLAFDFMDLTG
jgi:hypothetical protein